VDVIDDEQVGVSESLSELVESGGFESDDELVGEFFSGDVEESCARSGLGNGIADALEEMGFSEAAGAVDEEGVEVGARFGDDGACGAVGKLVGVADDEGIEFESEVGGALVLLWGASPG